MFKQIHLNSEKVIKKLGVLFISKVKDIHHDPRLLPRITDAQHSVCYVNNVVGGTIHRLFDFEIGLTEQILVIRKLVPSDNSHILLDEGSYYMYLDWTFEKFPIWAKKYKKSKVRVQTGMRHCNEFFLKHRYRVLQIGSLADKIENVGIKEAPL